jgi:hypothetical protein
LGVELAQSRNEDGGIPTTVGMMPPHELTAAHVPVVIHTHVPFPGNLCLTLNRTTSWPAEHTGGARSVSRRAVRLERAG